MFEDAIIALEQRIHRLLENLSGFETQVEALGEAAGVTELKEIRALFADTCEALGELRGTLQGEASPLRELVTRLGAALLAIEPDKLEQLYEAERSVLRRMRLSDAAIEQALAAMRERAEELLAPQGIEVEEVITSIGEFEKLICEIGRLSDESLPAINLEVVKGCVSGMIQVCVIAGDVVSVFTVPDPTPFTFLRSVKSVYSGVGALRRVTGDLRERFASRKNQMALRRRRGAPRKPK